MEENPTAEVLADNSRSLAVAGDAVAEFTEVAAARGVLGRFPGCEMMGIVKCYASAEDAYAGG